jgi:hypothetical protein
MAFQATCSQKSRLPGRVRHLLELLLEARSRAEQIGRDPWDFAEEIQSLRAAGGPGSDLRWLVCQGYAAYAYDATTRAGRKRRFRRAMSLSFTPDSCFVLTDAGVKFARRIHRSNGRQGSPNGAPRSRDRPKAALPMVPVWDAGCRRLWYADELVKEFRVPSPNQELILAAFQETGWPPYIDDPLPPQPNIESHKRLHDTINRLNRRQRTKHLRFRGNGGGTGILWEPIA